MASPSTLHRSLELAGTLPALMVAADRVAATVIQGVHGRRRVGQGDAFWQYRPFRDGDSATQIDLSCHSLRGELKSSTHATQGRERRELGSASSGTESAHGLFLSRAPAVCRRDSRVDRESDEPADSQPQGK